MIESSIFFFLLRCIIHQQCMAYFIFSFGISHSERPITAFLFPYSLNHRPGNDNAFPLFCHPNNQIPRKPKKKTFLNWYAYKNEEKKQQKLLMFMAIQLTGKAAWLFVTLVFFLLFTPSYFFRLLYSQHFSLLFLLWMNEWHFTRRFRMKKQFFFSVGIINRHRIEFGVFFIFFSRCCLYNEMNETYHRFV